VVYCVLENQGVLEGYNISGYREFYRTLENHDALESYNTSGYRVFSVL
jgi:hypothetical protein